MKYPINNPFKPSIKLEPFIKTKMQNEIKKKAKKLFSRSLSIKSILVEAIVKSKLYTKKNTTNIFYL